MAVADLTYEACSLAGAFSWPQIPSLVHDRCFQIVYVNKCTHTHTRKYIYKIYLLLYMYNIFIYTYIILTRTHTHIYTYI